MPTKIADRPQAVPTRSTFAGLKPLKLDTERMQTLEQNGLTAYTVKDGDTLWNIWEQTGRALPWEDFLALNDTITKHAQRDNGNKIIRGDVVVVPKAHQEGWVARETQRTTPQAPANARTREAGPAQEVAAPEERAGVVERLNQHHDQAMQALRDRAHGISQLPIEARKPATDQLMQITTEFSNDFVAGTKQHLGEPAATEYLKTKPSLASLRSELGKIAAGEQSPDAAPAQAPTVSPEHREAALVERLKAESAMLREKAQQVGKVPLDNRPAALDAVMNETIRINTETTRKLGSKEAAAAFFEKHPELSMAKLRPELAEIVNQSSKGIMATVREIGQEMMADGAASMADIRAFQKDFDKANADNALMRYGGGVAIGTVGVLENMFHGAKMLAGAALANAEDAGKAIAGTAAGVIDDPSPMRGVGMIGDGIAAAPGVIAHKAGQVAENIYNTLGKDWAEIGPAQALVSAASWAVPTGFAVKGATSAAVRGVGAMIAEGGASGIAKTLSKLKVGDPLPGNLKVALTDIMEAELQVTKDAAKLSKPHQHVADALRGSALTTDQLAAVDQLLRARFAIPATAAVAATTPAVASSAGLSAPGAGSLQTMSQVARGAKLSATQREALKEYVQKTGASVSQAHRDALQAVLQNPNAPITAPVAARIREMAAVQARANGSALGQATAAAEQAQAAASASASVASAQIAEGAKLSAAVLERLEAFAAAHPGQVSGAQRMALQSARIGTRQGKVLNKTQATHLRELAETQARPPAAPVAPAPVATTASRLEGITAGQKLSADHLAALKEIADKHGSRLSTAHRRALAYARAHKNAPVSAANAELFAEMAQIATRVR